MQSFSLLRYFDILINKNLTPESKSLALRILLFIMVSLKNILMKKLSYFVLLLLLYTNCEKQPTAKFKHHSNHYWTFEAIVFNNLSFESYFYEWDFGEGSTSFGVKVDHEYNDDGNYTVTLKVIDDYGAIDSFNKTIKVLNRFPVASFTKTVTNVILEETIYFDASESYDPDGTIINYTWDFGDGNTTTGITTNHTYHKEKTYIVTLTVTDDDGAMSSEVVEISAESESNISLFWKVF